MLGRTDLVSALQGEGQYTLLAPTNAAFQRLDRGLMDRLVRGDAKCLQSEWGRGRGVQLGRRLGCGIPETGQRPDGPPGTGRHQVSAK